MVPMTTVIRQSSPLTILALLLGLLPTAQATLGQTADSLPETDEGRSGLWLRGAFGGGSGRFTADSRELVGGSGLGLLSVGRFVRDNLVLFGELASTSIPGNVAWEGQGGEAPQDSVTTSWTGVGVGVGYYVPSGRIFLGASLLLGPMTVNEGDDLLLARSGWGVGVSLAVGKDIPVSDKWALGVAGHAGLARAPGRDLPGAWGTRHHGLCVTVSYAREGWGRGPHVP
jgi:hypothetical protein